jgi:uncharacterized protein
MFILDVNVLIYAHRQDAHRHREYAAWMMRLTESERLFSIPAVVRSGFVRIVTNPKAFKTPTPLEQGLRYIGNLLECENHVDVAPGPRHWDHFAEICRKAGVKGNLASDAYLAALALEAGGEIVTADQGFARFPGLQWRHPLDTKD